MNWRTFYADSDDKLTTRGVRATERPVSFIPKGALTHHPEGGGGIHFVARALCEADAASAEALWTMPQLCGAAVIVHADGYMFCFSIKTVVSIWKQLAACQ